MTITLQVGLDVISSYKRLAYTPWHAIAELVDNSTQSYFNNKDQLNQVANPFGTPLTVTIEYNSENGGLLKIEDNAMGMSYDELERALIIAKPPINTSGRSKYGMGLKTAACWIGNYWTVTTKKLGETIEHVITVDVDKISQGDNDLHYFKREGIPAKKHYTIIEILRHNRQFKGRTLSKIEQYLGSMYREDFRNDILTLYWRGKVLKWIELDNGLLRAKDGGIYKKNFDFTIQGAENVEKRIYGWVGILDKGSRSAAGFSILHSGRVVRGWPDSWRPTTLYGQEQGSNDLVNQRLVGEIHLDDFDVSHTKDDILWLGDEQDQVEDNLYEHCKDYREVADRYRKSRDDVRGPSQAETSVAIDEFQKELSSPELADIVNNDPMLPEQLVQEVITSVTEFVTKKYKERFTAQIDKLLIKGYIEFDISPNDPYVTIESTKDTEVIVIVNAAHPHWNQLEGAKGVLNYLRHCTYDGIAEWQAATRVQRKDSDTVKLLKDRLLRIPLDIERHMFEEPDLPIEDLGA
jgi:hypothetical protein